MNRRAFLLGCTAVAAATVMPGFGPGIPDIRIRWQSWPFDAARPDEWGTGTGSLKYFLTRLQRVWPEAVWEKTG